MAFDFPSNPTTGQVFTPPSAPNLSYEYNGYAWVTGVAAGGGTSGDFVKKAGDTMTGFLTLSADPTQPMHATTKQYVDGTAAGLPLGGVVGEALVKDAVNNPAWGAPIQGGSF